MRLIVSWAILEVSDGDASVILVSAMPKEPCVNMVHFKPNVFSCVN